MFFIFCTRYFCICENKDLKKYIIVWTVTRAPVPAIRALITRAEKEAIIESEPSNHAPAISAPATRAKKEVVAKCEHSNHSAAIRKPVTRVKMEGKSSNLPTLTHFIDTAYKNELKRFHESDEQLNVGDAVIARMRGFLPWPARVQSFAPNNKMINCYFYGTHNFGLIGKKNIMPFPCARETVRLVCLRSPNGYIKGVKEIEIEHDVPEGLSCLNELKSIN